MNQCKEVDVQDLVAYIQQLESDLAKKDCIIDAQDRRIAALEGLDASTMKKPTATHDGRSTNSLSPHLNSKNTTAPNKSFQVSDDSCETESDVSFSTLGLSLLERDCQSDDLLGAFQSDGRWNIPFDDSSYDDLVPKSFIGRADPHATALNDNFFKPIKRSSVDIDISEVADGFADIIRPAAIPCVFPFRHAGISPILHPVRRGLLRVDSDGSDKENIDPNCGCKKHSDEICNLSQGFNSPCR